MLGNQRKNTVLFHIVRRQHPLSCEHSLLSSEPGSLCCCWWVPARPGTTLCLPALVPGHTGPSSQTQAKATCSLQAPSRVQTELSMVTAVLDEQPIV